MRKSKLVVLEAAHTFVESLRARFPEVTADISAESWEGSDAWVVFMLPAGYDDTYREAVLDETVRLSLEVREKTRVKIIASLDTKEPVHG
jgi:hypothetical protein